MEFIVKDLMINVLPLRPSPLSDVAAGCDAGCTSCSACTTCTSLTNCPGGCTSVTPHPPALYSQVSNPAALALLKQQLREALAAVEAREQVVHQAMRPKSATEIEILQSHLEAALEDLRRMSSELTRQETEGYQQPESQEAEE